MKSPNFWKYLSWQTLLLLPFSAIYFVVAFLRQKLTPSYKIDIPIVCVGNVTAGGAGKTPIALAIAKMLIGMKKNPMFLSRGYGGNLNVTTIVDTDIHNAKQTGDEPLLLSEVAHTVISKDRVAGSRLIYEKNADFIIMDDGLQNPSLKKTLSLLVIDGNFGIGNGCLIPAGPMRELFKPAINKADAVIFIGEDKNNLLTRIKDKKIIKAKIVTNLKGDKNKKYIAFAGIANPTKFFQTLKENDFNTVEEINYADHYQYEDKDIIKLKEKAYASSATLITTEKDFVRLTESQKEDIQTLPIEIKWQDESQVSTLLELLC